MGEANSLVNNVLQYSAAGGTIAAAIGYRVLSTFVDLGVSGSILDEEDSVGDKGKGGSSSVSAKASNMLNTEWFWKSGSGSCASATQQKQYSGIGFDLEFSLPLFTLKDVSYHDMPHDCWIVLYDRVYDITSFLNSHPGGDEIMLEYAGHDATLAFRSVGHSKEAEESLKPYLVGILVESERIWTRFFNMKSDIP